MHLHEEGELSYHERPAAPVGLLVDTLLRLPAVGLVKIHWAPPCNITLRTRSDNTDNPSEICSYRKTSNISRTLVGNKIVDNSDVVGASPVGAAPTTSSFST